MSGTTDAQITAEMNEEKKREATLILKDLELAVAAGLWMRAVSLSNSLVLTCEGALSEPPLVQGARVPSDEN